MKLVTHSVELVGGWLLAGFRGLPAHLADRESVAGRRVMTPHVRLTVLVEINLECSVRINGPDGAERVSPCAGCGSGRARAHERYQSAGENNSERVLWFHGRHPASRQRDRSSADLREEIGC